MKNFINLLLLLTAVFTVSSCKKNHFDNQDIYQYVPPPAKPISDATPLCGSVSGTMLSGKTYTVSADIQINAGDSLVIEPGVRINFQNSAGIIVRGNFFSLGTKDNPVYLTVSGQTRTDNPKTGYKASADSAFLGKWKGVLGDVTCKYMVFKWTHLEYCGAPLGAGKADCSGSPSAAYTILGLTASDNSYAVYFSNPNGYLVFEDSWIYGTIDDAIRVGGAGGKFAILRSTFEKCGKTGGDVLNIKAGGVGDMGYNFFMGCATNALKAANSGSGPGIAQCEATIYNNTLVSCGFRQTKTGRGGSINFENSARGKCFNNLIVNCKFGLRLSSNVPDTAYLYNNNYGYNYYWADSLSTANQIFPYTPGAVTKPVETDFPKPSSYLPVNYNYRPCVSYDGSQAVQKGNPLFFNYPLPVTGGFYLADMNAIGNFKFTLKPGSPCIGRGFTGFTPLQVVPVDPKYGVTEYTQPGMDVGCYQYIGTGNQHF
ncbi:MAG: hypothetical protein U0X40_09345 [Ferruginibacter sp.]